MPELQLNVLSLRYSSWSMRAWLALQHAGARFTTKTVELPEMARQASGEGGLKAEVTDRAARRKLGSVTGLFPVLWVDGTPIHEALAICESPIGSQSGHSYGLRSGPRLRAGCDEPRGQTPAGLSGDARGLLSGGL